jgi:hypothetical protein
VEGAGIARTEQGRLCDPAHVLRTTKPARDVAAAAVPVGVMLSSVPWRTGGRRVPMSAVAPRLPRSALFCCIALVVPVKLVPFVAAVGAVVVLAVGLVAVVARTLDSARRNSARTRT